MTPDEGLAPARVHNTGPYTALFTIENLSDTKTITVAVRCSGTNTLGTRCASISPTSMTLTGGQRKTATATYYVGAPGEGHISAYAGTDSGYYDVPIQ